MSTEDITKLLSNATLMSRYHKYVVYEEGSTCSQAINGVLNEVKKEFPNDNTCDVGTVVELFIRHPNGPDLKDMFKTETEATPINLGVFIEGGVVQKVVTDQPNDPVMERLTVTIIDEDARSVGEDFLSCPVIIEATEQDLAAMNLNLADEED